MPARWEKLARSGAFALVTDLDGTVVPFDADPSKARPTRAVVELLESLSRMPGTTVVVATGRPKQDLELSFGASDRIELVAEHGLWIREANRWAMTSEVGPEAFDHLAAAFEKIAAACAGAHVERKTRGVGLHYRRVVEDAREALLNAAEAAVDDEIRSSPELSLLRGHAVLEVRLGAVTKTSAVELARRLGGPEVHIVALGDDVTDEDMFRALSPRDLGVVVGTPPWTSAATMSLAGPDEAIALLERIVATRAAVSG
ncbi:MAG: trehalose-phosphatase [Polyangiaceae bacterium]|nr:trehalose-phosphatase [Polyangiaceae bacterium]